MENQNENEDIYQAIKKSHISKAVVNVKKNKKRNRELISKSIYLSLQEQHWFVP